MPVGEAAVAIENGDHVPLLSQEGIVVDRKRDHFPMPSPDFYCTAIYICKEKIKLLRHRIAIGVEEK